MYPFMHPIISMYPLKNFMHPRVHHAPRLTITGIKDILLPNRLGLGLGLGYVLKIFLA